MLITRISWLSGVTCVVGMVCPPSVPFAGGGGMALVCETHEGAFLEHLAALKIGKGIRRPAGMAPRLITHPGPGQGDPAPPGKCPENAPSRAFRPLKWQSTDGPARRSTTGAASLAGQRDVCQEPVSGHEHRSRWGRCPSWFWRP